MWRSILDVLAAAAAANRKEGEVLAEALPEALKNMLLVLHSKVRTVLGLILAPVNLVAPVNPVGLSMTRQCHGLAQCDASACAAVSGSTRLLQRPCEKLSGLHAWPPLCAGHAGGGLAGRGRRGPVGLHVEADGAHCALAVAAAAPAMSARRKMDSEWRFGGGGEKCTWTMHACEGLG